MNKKALAVLCVFGIVAASAALHAEKKFTYSLHGITFDASIDFSSPEKAGLDALIMLHPKKSKLGKEKMSITAVLYDRNAQKLMGMGDAGLLNYTRTVFLGSDKVGKPIERVFAGKTIKGQVWNKKIPAPSTVEVYVITLSKGNKIGLGFCYNQDLKADEAQKVIVEIGASIRE